MNRTHANLPGATFPGFASLVTRSRRQQALGGALVVQAVRSHVPGEPEPYLIMRPRSPRHHSATAGDGESVTMAEGSLTWFRPLRRDRTRRLFVVGGAGHTFEGSPLEIDQFALGGPARMTAFGIGEARGDHYIYAGGGYLHRLFRLPDFLGRSVFAGGWVESGSAWDRGGDADLTVHGSVGIIADTLIGPVFAGMSAGIKGESRFYIGIGRIFR